MEEWQQDHIKNNFSKLASCTEFSDDFISQLETKGFLTPSDILYVKSQDENTKVAQYGLNYIGGAKIEARSSKLYSILMGKKSSYAVLMDMLLIYDQRTSFKILLNGYVNKAKRNKSEMMELLEHHYFC